MALSPEQFGQKLKSERKRNGLTQSELALRLKVDTGTISRWENGLVVPQFEHFSSICEILGKNPDFFYEANPKPIPDASSLLKSAELLTATQSRISPESTVTDLIQHLIEERNKYESELIRFKLAFDNFPPDLVNALSQLSANGLHKCLEYAQSLRTTFPKRPSC